MSLTTLRKRCAWCEHELPEAERDQGQDVTHGICGPHKDTLLAEVRARRAMRPDA